MTDINTPDDSWLDSWDFIIHRCTACLSPFRSPSRLALHHTLSPNCIPTAPTISFIDLTQVSLTTIDPNGDLEVHVGPTESTITHRFLVASQVLRCQSRAFNASFSPTYGFKASADLHRAHLLGPHASRRPAVIYLDDNADVLALIFKVLHHCYHELEQEYPYETLVDLVTVCEKYMLHVPLAPMLRLWANAIWDGDFWWKREFGGGDDGREEVESQDGWLLVAWVLGLEDEFREVSRYVAMNYGVTEGGEWVAPNGRGMHPAIPEVVKEKLLEVRGLLLNPIRQKFEEIQAQRMLHHIPTLKTATAGIVIPQIPYPSPSSFSSSPSSDPLNAPENNTTTAPTTPKHPPPICRSNTPDSPLCDYLQLGHLLTTLTTHPLSTPPFWTRSVHTIISFFAALDDPVPLDEYFSDGHETRRRKDYNKLRKALDDALVRVMGVADADGEYHNDDYDGEEEKEMENEEDEVEEVEKVDPIRFRPWEKARSCSWVNDMRFVCEAVEKLRADAVGLELWEFASRREVWGEVGGLVVGLFE
ncbi:hypothetical protein EX30DRAFT_350602 [Ascodesmis nigricans]|uniref:BTB domain-containing protein n=1 Tax=Ascodesmis nigricans TaxID=341454 RepID=A0A4S2MPA9_9PEZI|nr:hypothetical protein EX30DRAFT_350602 [Ascodesmis nigricans]